MSLTVKLTVAVDEESLDSLHRPLGTRIATNDNKIMELDSLKRGRYWIQPGTLEPFYLGHPLPASWFPAIILPPVVDLSKESQ